MEESREIQKLKEEFSFTLSQVSHEIRNPVTLIHGFLRMLATNHPEVEDYEYWNDIQDNMAYLMDLLNELSTYNNASHLATERTDPINYFREVVNSTAVTMEYLGIQLTFQWENSLPMVNLDQVKMKQAVLNLLRNASEAISGEGHIAVSLKQYNNQVLLTITDDGCGIPEAYMDNLFEPFVTHKKEGSGLGLAVTRQIVLAHQGTITVESTPGEGTSFVISLPVPADDKVSYTGQNQ